MDNNVTEFVLMGFSPNLEVQTLCSILFLTCYLIVFLGNLLIFITIRCSHLIDQPMYFFLSLLSAMDLCYTSTVVPQMIRNLLGGSKTISFSNCMAQLFAVHFFGGVEIFILVGMAFDRYVAICRPLRYMAIMNKLTCHLLILAACGLALLHSFAQTLMVANLSFCDLNQVDHFFCDVKPLLKLVCTDTHTINILVVANSGMVSLVTFFILVISYAVILYNLRTYSASDRYRALSTCSSHITVVVIFFVPCIFTYTLPPNAINEDQVFAVLYTVLAPMLNPFIYTLRNLEMKTAIRKVWYKKAFLRKKQNQ
ncbi:olfactory receptor 4P4-like [Ornithorhynchus anatinus]|uniref:olfactory receptor 4P4-like n=1 Tax=Ornithorhynchus anatinus TaxID=9258 RepID=UPI0010A88DED|nr:olfactory receptor 4P4-like [Ornithorhynchus anatinus]